MDADFLWHSIGGGAVIAAALTVVRLILEHFAHRAERRTEREERRGMRQRDAEARLERVLQDRLAEADRRLEREHLLLLQAHELLKEQYAVLQAERIRLLQEAAELSARGGRT